MNNAYNIVLAIEGNKISSIEFAKKLDQWLCNSSNKVINFIIGSSYGISPLIKQKADFLFSFSDLTFPHQLMRILLLEQIYRCFTINKKIKYHK